jgi:hypothetical protein
MSYSTSYSVSYSKIFFPVWVAGLLLLIGGGILFVLLRAFGLPIGELADWAIGIASFWWLVVIVTLPWNLYFQAKAVQQEAVVSQERGIPVEDSTLAFLQKLSRWSLRVAIALHGLSALAFYGLAVGQVTPIGYPSAVAAVLLTALRPAIRGYEYLADRLAQLQGQIQIPREDAIELAEQIKQLTRQVEQLQEQWDPGKPGSWAQQEEETRRYLRQELAALKAQLEQFRASNELEHRQLRQETHQAVAQLSVDSQFLGHVREILRFIKEA